MYFSWSFSWLLELFFYYRLALELDVNINGKMADRQRRSRYLTISILHIITIMCQGTCMNYISTCLIIVEFKREKFSDIYRILAVIIQYMWYDITRLNLPWGINVGIYTYIYMFLVNLILRFIIFTQWQILRV